MTKICSWDDMVGLCIEDDMIMIGWWNDMVRLDIENDMIMIG